MAIVYLSSDIDELNKLDGYTGSVTELNYLDTLHATGVTDTEFDYLDGVTSNIQTQLATKTSITSGTFTPSFTAGFSSVPSGLDMRYQIIGDGTNDYVFMTTASGAALTGTSNATGFTWSGIPVAARPDVAVTSGSFVATNAGYAQMNAVAQIATDGTVTMAAQPISGDVAGPWWQNAGWTASGTKGFAQGMIIMYLLNVTA